MDPKKNKETTAVAAVDETNEPQAPAVDPATPAQPEQELSAEFEAIDCRINIRGDEQAQAKYNVLVTDPVATAMLDRLGEKVGFDPKNAQGQYYLSCTSDGRTAMELKRQGGGAKALLVSGIITVVDTANGRPTGHITVCDAAGRVVGSVRKANILDGGLNKLTTAREVPSTNRTILGGGAPTTGLRSSRLSR